MNQGTDIRRFTTLMADWMAARLAGKMLASERWLVDASGRTHKRTFQPTDEISHPVPGSKETRQ
jgi:hypothetical protein